MRGAAVLVACAACGSVGPGTAPLPEPPRTLADLTPRLAPGEQSEWNVFYQGVQVGRADMIVDERAAHTTFRTSGAARVLTSAHFELATALDRGHARGVRELLTLGAKTDRAEAVLDGARFTPAGGDEQRVPGGTRLHTLHSALGVIRAWSADRTPLPGYLWVWSGGELYRLDVARPAREDVFGVRTLRVDGTVRAPHLDESVTVSIWLAANADRTPIRLTLRSGSHLVAAEVYASTASLEAR